MQNKDEHADSAVYIYDYLVFLCKNNMINKDAAILWTGGEPTLVPWLEDGVRLLAAFLDRPQDILTNAVVYSDVLAQCLSEGMVKLMVSLDSGTRDTYALVKGKDCFDTVAENLKRYGKNASDGILMKYIFVPGKNVSKDEFDAFYELCREIETEHITVTFDYLHKTLTEEEFEILLYCADKDSRIDFRYQFIADTLTPSQCSRLERALKKRESP
jgi:MoaA/NifB/PqqE/SkfB family radical SAM enzyme